MKKTICLVMFGFLSSLFASETSVCMDLFVSGLDKGSFQSLFDFLSKKQKNERTYYENGKLKSLFLKKDEIYKEFYNDGKTLQCLINKEGMKGYDNNGEMLINMPLNGIAIGHEADGAVSFAFELKNGVFEGVAKGYYESGKLEYETPYKNGKEEGVVKGYYENGKLEYETPYKDGKKRRCGEKLL